MWVGGKRREEPPAGLLSMGSQGWDELLHSRDGAASRWCRNNVAQGQHQLGKALLATSHHGNGMCHSFHPGILHGLVDLELNSRKSRDSSLSDSEQGAMRLQGKGQTCGGSQLAIPVDVFGGLRRE